MKHHPTSPSTASSDDQSRYRLASIAISIDRSAVKAEGEQFPLDPGNFSSISFTGVHDVIGGDTMINNAKTCPRRNTETLSQWAREGLRARWKRFQLSFLTVNRSAWPAINSQGKESPSRIENAARFPPPSSRSASIASGPLFIPNRQQPVERVSRIDTGKKQWRVDEAGVDEEDSLWGE